MTQPIIKLEHVNFWYNKGELAELEALKDVGLEIEAGSYVAFFGPSGSGKTTLLYLIAGVESSQEGRIMIRDKDISKFSNKELAIYRQIGVGIVFQQFNLIPTLTVAANVALPMAFLGISEKKRKEEAMKILKRLGIDHLSERYPTELSGGQQQRVGIARALSNNAPIIIADEPLGNLDSENSQKVLEFFKELHEKDQRTIIMVTHEAWSLRDVEVIFHMKDGQVVQVEKTAKQDIAKSLSEKLAKELTKEETEAEKTASMLAGVLLRGFTNEEIIRFQNHTNQRLSGKISAIEFLQILDKPFKEGGVGLWKQTALKISNYVEDVIKKRARVANVYQKLWKNPLAVIKIEVVGLRKWLLSEYHGKLDRAQLVKLDEALSNRLRNKTTADDFMRIFTLSKAESGMGFAMHTAGRIAERLELVLNVQIVKK